MDSADAPDPTPEPAHGLDVEAEQQRLDELGERIEATRRKAEDDLEPGHGQREFSDSGDARGEQDDDQTIAPG